MKDSRVFIKIKLKDKMEITETGYLKAQDILDQLYENEHIDKQVENVVIRLDNLLYDGLEIRAAYLDVENEYVILDLDGSLRY